MTAAVDPQFSRPAVYALLDPASGAVRYIGKSVNPRERYLAHIERARKGVDTHQYRWIRSLLRHKRTPIMILLQFADDLDKAERFWIKYHRDRGADLTNITDGGTGGRTQAPKNCEHGDFRTDPLLAGPTGNGYYKCRLCRLNKLRGKTGLSPWSYDEYRQQREQGTKVVCRRRATVRKPAPHGKPRTLCIICQAPVPDRPSRPGASSERKTCSRTCYLVRRSQWTSPNKGAGRTHPCITCGTPCRIQRKNCSPTCLTKHLSQRAAQQHADGLLGPPRSIVGSQEKLQP